MRAPSSSPAFRGTALALVSALAFGATTPLVQRLERGAGSFAIACLLYAGASIAGVATRSRAEATLSRAHLPRVVVVAVFGALLAPALLAWGLARASGIAASLMLNLEAVFTIGLARLLYAEHVGRRVAAAAGAMVLGGALLVVGHGQGASGEPRALGLVAVALAALGWAVDNAVGKPLSALDPAAVVAAKGAIGAALSASMTIVMGQTWPAAAPALGLMLVGATGYGLSLRLYLVAQRALGAGRTASVFASAPFWGAGLAWMLGEPAGPWTLLAAVAMIAGLVLHLTERHAHEHVHETLEHEHLHRHDDGHHLHVHDPMPVGPHSHVHRHETMVHDHPHVPDMHHEHGHVHRGNHGPRGDS